MVVPRSCSNGSPELKVKGDDVDGSRAGIGVEKDLFLLQSGREDVSNSGGKSGRFGESLDCYVQKVIAGEEDFEGDGRGSSVGRKVYLEGIMGLEGKSGQLEEGSFVLQKAHRVNVLLVGEDGGLGQA